LPGWLKNGTENGCCHGDAEGTADTAARALRKFREVFAAIVVHAESGAHDDVVKETRSPRDADARREAPTGGR